jgi:propane monooxygenase reductase subunit
LLRALVEQGSSRTGVYYYGAREERDLFDLDELGKLAEALPNLGFVPALSHQDWEGETGLITEVVDRRESDLADVDAYLCGPPPMVDAAIDLLVRRGVPEAHIYYDKFTTAADAAESSRS